jgi:hypothetical protein
MSKNIETQGKSPETELTWERPSLRYLGHVGEIFLFPGGGKISNASYDSGDTPYKPKGQDH